MSEQFCYSLLYLPQLTRYLQFTGITCEDLGTCPRRREACIQIAAHGATLRPGSHLTPRVPKRFYIQIGRATKSDALVIPVVGRTPSFFITVLLQYDASDPMLEDAFKRNEAENGPK